MKPGGQGDVTLPATAVTLGAHGVLIIGKSGSGKSALALALMAFGAQLIADDQVTLNLQDGMLFARRPATLPPLIEARGIGLLPVDAHPGASVLVGVDMDRAPPRRLPSPCHIDILGVSLPLLAGQVGAHLAPSLIHMLTTGHVPHHD